MGRGFVGRVVGRRSGGWVAGGGWCCFLVWSSQKRTEGTYIAEENINIKRRMRRKAGKKNEPFSRGGRPTDAATTFVEFGKKTNARTR